ncbi:molybdopterin oxidoreductase family protein [Arcobacter sp. FWKO B]|uniref:molybdopterin oxidoreductase family protein n=1 Tax=Arcobacter sp. FWKO B TaxID=2593672 RepID=UPI0018A521B0|nr:molybdopterin-dependent oxidoreductase [Arcobacter sp. FWKO B]QOG12528.1 molybdopterin-dependent oxidoreductase [Arcobacter sp. FWKO B]
MTTDINSVCTYCGVGCDITAVVANNKITKIYAQSDGYVSRGKLCIKGKYGYDFVDSPNRIRTPRIKKSFIEKNFDLLPIELKARSKTLKDFDDTWYEANYEFATSLSAWKLNELKNKYGRHSFCATGGARTSCESGWMLQKFTRTTMESPHIDNCARVCHSPSLKGLKTTIGEGAATNPYDDIFKSEFLLVIGSNTTEAHPIVANRMIEASRDKIVDIAVIDVREIHLGKFAKYNAVIPYEANLLVLNMMAYVILSENLYNTRFINTRCSGFEEYKNSILNDEFANPKFFESLKGYEDLAELIPVIAREYATKKSMIFWGLGISEHLDGSKAVMAIANLALLTGNIGQVGAGLMPLRGQNNVQGTCDVGCLPYYEPDYKDAKEVGLTTPELIDAMIDGKIKSMYIMGEDLAHIHPNQNKINQALENLELIITQELFMNEIAKKSDIVFGVKSAYEKTGVYVNAMRRLHLSQPLVECDLPDDWEVLRDIENKLKGDFLYESSEQVWDGVRTDVSRYKGASYMKLSKHRSKGMQWPIDKDDTPILHLEDFRTSDGLGHLTYNPYVLRGQIQEIIDNNASLNTHFYLTTGRTLVHYNNSAQTKESPRLNDKYPEDIILANIEDSSRLGEKVVLKTEFGQTTPLSVKFVKSVKKGTLYSTFHHAKSHINYIFGDEADEFTKTARFKSLKVEVCSE